MRKMVRKSMGKTCLVMLIFAVVSTVLFGQNDGDGDPVIGRIWLERADQLLRSVEKGNKETLAEASESLKIALEYETSPGRDALYLQAVLLLLQSEDIPIESNIRQAYELLGKSIDDVSRVHRMDITSFEDRAILWSSLSLRLKDYRTMLNRYSEWPQGNRYNPLLLYAAARATLYLGLDEKAAELAAAGEALSLPDTNLKILNPSFPAEAQPAFRALSVAAGDSLAVSTLSAAWKRWPHVMEEVLRPWLLSGYVRPDEAGTLPKLLSPELSRILLLMHHSSPDTEMRIPRVYMTDLALLRQVRQAGSKTGRQLVNRLLSNFTGDLDADFDYDGNPEETVTLAHGRIEKWTIDSDQDGVPEWSITYENGRPLQVQNINVSGQLSIIYAESNYPFLHQLHYRTNKMDVVLSLNPGAFSWEVEGKQGFWAEPHKPVWNEDELWNGTRVVTYTAANPDYHNYSFSETFLSRGLPIKTVEKNYSDETMDTLLWIREIIYDEGVPVAGRRSYHRESKKHGKRLWELYERYERSRMVGLAWDPGMTGTPEYLRDWALNRYLETQVWDLDRDGWMDVLRLQMPHADNRNKELLITEAESHDLLPWNAADWSPWEQ